MNQKLVADDGHGCNKLRIWYRKWRNPRVLVKCGCCDYSLEIHYGHEDLTIGGVSASRTEWNRLLRPFFCKPRQPNVLSSQLKGLCVWHTKAIGEKMDKITIKESKSSKRRLEIFYDERILEINGVMSSIQEWRNLLANEKIWLSPEVK
jgi:hypothetical protein